MSITSYRPHLEDLPRREIAAERRAIAARHAGRYTHHATHRNAEERLYADERYPTSFTKGLPHDACGQLEDPEHYRSLVKEINGQDATRFEALPHGLDADRPPATRRADGEPVGWRGWESPRAGHYFDLQGPDADAVGLPPAPELGSEELIAEMAEVYALALLRDVPFGDIENGTGSDAQSGITTEQVLDALGALSWFTDASDAALSLQERRRRAARRIDHGTGFAVNDPPDGASFDTAKAFRGSGPAAKTGPYVSQFMLLGNNRSASGGAGTPIDDSSIAYGTQVIDQKIETFAAHHDFMVHWNAYLDVQRGADFGDANERVRTPRRFIATPRDLAAYVRYDALYQAYLNACLFMLGEADCFRFQQPVDHPHTGVAGPGFPDGPPSEARQAFAAFGGPHVLSLVTEVATRCLKAVRRQKFNYHRRARPERIGALLTLHGTMSAGCAGDVSGELGERTRSALTAMAENLAPLLELVDAHNRARADGGTADVHLDFDTCPDPDWFEKASNYLLPMAFAEGSPMHPSYGAGHATVAGGCVTMLKAFFDTTEADGTPRPWPEALPIVRANADGSALERLAATPDMTVNGELNKLAANISIGRDMAGVHYYTDYYESLRMGERVATGILIEQMKQYDEPLEMDFESFDGDRIHILKNDYDYAAPRVFVHDAQGEEVSFESWWSRHLVDEEEDSTALRLARKDVPVFGDGTGRPPSKASAPPRERDSATG